MFWIYLADLSDKLYLILLAAGGLTLFISGMGADHINRVWIPISLGITLIIIACILPSKQTSYLMIASHPTITGELPNKAFLIINNELDRIINKK